jgi:hypothetical protein
MGMETNQDLLYKNPTMKSTFLKAHWKNLIMANYEIDAAILQPFVPAYTELDLYNGRCLVSIVAFQFLNTRVKGLALPFHTNFDEVNLRFYVRYADVDGYKRGAVFIKEMVPKHMITLVANSIYGEHYETLPVKHELTFKEASQRVRYQWYKNKKWNELTVTASLLPIDILPGSEEEFITEHYWGYTRLGKQKTSEYGVEHPRWLQYPVTDQHIDIDFKANYGDRFAFMQTLKPSSVLMAVGSDIAVKGGRRLPVAVNTLQ